MLRFKIMVLTASVASFLFISCTQNISRGTLIKANGTLIDTVKNKKLNGIKVYLAGGNYTSGIHSGGWFFDKILDSVITDASGNFTFQYSAEGGSEDYAVSIERTIHSGSSGITNDGYPVYSFNKKNELKNCVVYARELNYVKLHLKVLSNPFDTIIVDVYNYSYYRPNYLIAGKTADTTLLAKCLVPNSANFIFYDLTNAKLQSLTGTHYEKVVLYDSLFANLNDTIEVFRTITSTNEFVVKSQYEFSFAGIDSGEITLPKILQSRKLTPHNPKLKIISFCFRAEADGTGRSKEIMVNCDSLNSEGISILKKTSAKFAWLYFEKVMAAGRNGDTTQLSDLQLKLKN